ncbi:hypothetical protein FIBSPDRAFT_1051721 [Athelia psychrophila]|uniref:Uncharacterized protein n=1 Tax=Athelia psychrophila TaxID=1759441 RepID=A0A165YLW4_9AGAM|nr:hypothetical protein FIBSPDRAFT_1051721 [Fibularhizoctonia sp. CBS 109695]
MDRRHFSHPAAAASLAEQGVNPIFGPTYWPGFDSEPFPTQSQSTAGSNPTTPHKTTSLPSSTPFSPPASSRETVVVMANTDWPVAEGPAAWRVGVGVAGGGGPDPDDGKVKATDQIGKIGSL